MRHPKGMAMLGAIVDVNSLIETAGYPLVFLLVTAESAGVPVPGETALIAGAVFASQGRLSLPAVIATAAAASLQEPERGGTGADAQTGTHAQTRTRAETGAQGLTVGPVTEREHTGTRAQTGAQQEGPQQGAMRSHSSASELSS
jgi:hypothetical protein